MKERGNVSISLFDVSGRRVYGVKGIRNRGFYTQEFRVKSEGVYFIRFETEKLKEIKKVIFVR